MDDADKAKGGLSTFAAGLIGAAMGAAAVFFADRKNRDKVEKAFNDVGDMARSEFDRIVGKGKEKVRQKISEK